MSDLWGLWLDDRTPQRTRRERGGPDHDHAGEVSNARDAQMQEDPVPTWQIEAGRLQARFGNHAVGEMMRAAEHMQATDERDVAPADAVLDATESVENEKPGAAVITPVPEPKAEPGRDARGRTDPPDKDSGTVEVADRTDAAASARPVAAFLAAFEADPARAPWQALSDALTDAPDPLLERVVQGIAERAESLEPGQRKALDAALAEAERDGLMPEFLPRLRARLATLKPSVAPPPPPPPPPPPEDGS